MPNMLNLNDLRKYVTFIKEPSKSLLSEDSSKTIPTTITGLTSQSQAVQPGFLFIAEKGFSKDGHQFIPKAIAQGAIALLVEQTSSVPPDYRGWVLQTPDTRAIAPMLANLFYGKPSEKLFCTGTTGTNGKTSITYLIEHLFNFAQLPTGVIGTINHHLGSHVWNTEMTTPHPIELQSRLKEFVDRGAKTLAMEVSSHAIDQKRMDGIEFDVGIFTNLTRDHLDYHSTMEEYFAVKKSFFTQTLARSQKPQTWAIINTDDPWGKQIYQAFDPTSGAPLRTSVSTSADSAPNPSSTSSLCRWSYGEQAADLTYRLEQMDFTGTRFQMNTPAGKLNLQSPLLGVHNIYNVMAAVGASLAKGLSITTIEKALPLFTGIPGRLQRVPHSKSFSVLVDYAHSPDALENVLKALQQIKQQGNLQKKTTGRILCIFGCGGDRDKGKRPLMAQVAEKLADLVVVTSDNPRTEDPLQIIHDIQLGFTRSPTENSNIFIEPNRHKAIALALQIAQPHDVVLIAGKGHEDYQIIGKEKFFFSDFETARKLLQ